MLNFFKHFHTTSRLYQRPNHPLYKKLDWERINAGDYAVVDPFDNAAILYLTEKEYKVQVRVSFSQDHKLIVLALPGDSPTQETTDASNNLSSRNPPTPRELVKSNSKVWRKFLSWHLSSLRGLAKREGSPVKRDPRTESKASIVLSAAVLRTLIPYWGLDLHFRLGADLTPSRAHVRAYREFADHLAKLLETHGPNYLILKLKNTLFMLNKYLAGTPSDDPWLLGTPVGLAKSGIPRLIPLLFRRGVGQRDPTILRVLTSLLNSYRAFDGNHSEQDLDSIRGPLPSLDDKTFEEFKTFCKEEFWGRIVPNYAGPKMWSTLKNPEEFFRITETSQVVVPVRAGPNANPALLGAPLDALAWLERATNYPLKWAEHIGDARTPAIFMRVLRRLAPDLPEEEILQKGKVLKAINSQASQDGRNNLPSLHIGKVQCLPEPAGKVRTIAIVDYWTQRLMSPVHDWMMKILSFLPTDGTFDQEGALDSFARYLAIEGHGDVYSIDLKSATDLIPIKLYEALFEGIWQHETVRLWKAFLTDRWFHIPEREKLVVPSLRGCSIRYGRGQPMGTLSSWPSMALVHHALQLFAVKQAGRDPLHYVGYRVLGDDNVTKGTDVANAYVEVANKLCIPTSKAKTLHGSLFIFASQVFLKGVNISPLSLKEELGIQSYGQRLEQALRAIRRGWLGDKVTIPRLLRLLLTRKDYVNTVRGWSEGKLGRIAQLALVSAFGIASSKLLDLLGFQGSGVKPFSLAIANKVQAIAGDQGLTLSSRREAALRELETALAMRVATHLIEKLRGILDDLQVSSIRFRTWEDCVATHGFMPWATKVRVVLARGPSETGKYPRVPAEPGIPYVPGEYPEKELVHLFDTGVIPGHPANLPGAAPSDRPSLVRAWRSPLTKQMFCKSESLMHKALWEVVYDSYRSQFGIIARMEQAIGNVEVTEDYDDYEDDDGMGMSYSDKPAVTSHPSGWTVGTPQVITKVRSSLDAVMRIKNDLLLSDHGSPWLDLQGFAETVARLSRLPAFLGLGDFSPTELKTDELNQFMRKANIFFDILPYLPNGMDMSKPINYDLPVGPQGLEEALESLTANAV